MPDPITPETQTIPNAPGAATTAADSGAAPAQQQQAPRRPAVDDLPENVLKLRLDQERSKAERALLDRYSVSTPDELQAKLKKLSEHEENEKKRAEEDEAKKRATMSKEEQLAAQVQQLTARVAELESENTKLRSSVGSLRFDQTVRSLIGEYVRADMHDEAHALFAAHVKSLANMGETVKLKELETPSGMRTWFRNLAAKKPVYALPENDTPSGAAGSASGAKPPVKTAPPKKPITTGASPAKVTPPAGSVVNTVASRTFRPGTKNSIPDKEVGKEIEKRYGTGARIPGLSQ